MINIEAPQEPWDEVEKESPNIVAQPCVEEAGEWDPQPLRHEGPEQNAVVEVSVLHKELQIATWVVHGSHHSLQNNRREEKRRQMKKKVLKVERRERSK